MLKQSLIANVRGKATEDNIFVSDKFRFTLLTDCLIRTEYSQNGVFEDNATQSIWFRDTKKVNFSANENKSSFVIRTEKVIFYYSKRDKKVTSITFINNGKTVKCSNVNNLGGTYRTLDMNVGTVKLENGLISSDGVAVFDDSSSFTLLENGEIKKREFDETDIYIFAYGNDYRKCISDFYKIAGNVPLIPRYALGNWWSRYHAYTQNEYEQLMQRFEDEDIPLTVATIDMDWHWVDLKEKYPHTTKKRWNLASSLLPTGWTGYSWNTDLFPDYKNFFKGLKKRNLHITLNLHPADGVRAHEDMYPKMADAMGIDPDTKQSVDFRLSDANFWNNYFDIVHKPYEKDGVDFWWIDWQQGKEVDVKGLDPLWMLNHYHFLDNAKNGSLPLILSRYAGIGSHRYPLGFSGDTVICWNSLKLQPYFTATASNSGYTWWSHDIGGHTLGYRDDELYLRWVQLGVFSPINRLHSSNDDLLGKEPWRYSNAVENVSKKFLKLRHSLIPYIYTMDYRTYKQGIALCEPMYYSYPNEKESYKVKNQYFFGSELIACPITSKADGYINTASVNVWIPQGRWTDFFTGRIYKGNKTVTMHRDIDSFPLLAKEGAIIPLSANEGNSVDNPKNMDIHIFRGNGKFSLYEDDGTVDFENHNAVTQFKVRSDSANITFTKCKTTGDLSVVPQERNYTLLFRDAKKVRAYKVVVNGKTICEFETGDNIFSEKTFKITINDIKASDTVDVVIFKYTPTENEDYKNQIINIFSRMQCSTLKKDALYRSFKNVKSKEEARRIIDSLPVSFHTKTALIECVED